MFNVALFRYFYTPFKALWNTLCLNNAVYKKTFARVPQYLSWCVPHKQKLCPGKQWPMQGCYMSTFLALHLSYEIQPCEKA